MNKNKNDCSRVVNVLQEIENSIYEYINNMPNPNTFDSASLNIWLKLRFTSSYLVKYENDKVSVTTNGIDYFNSIGYPNAINNDLDNMIDNIVFYAHNLRSSNANTTVYSDQEIDDIFKELFGE